MEKEVFFIVWRLEDFVICKRNRIFAAVFAMGGITSGTIVSSRLARSCILEHHVKNRSNEAEGIYPVYAVRHTV